ncbi:MULTISPECIES: hypothetical protein [Cryobacterium]|uniref:Transmembrane protein n=1 Tax=Cryobacterium breve TaxID=1259258 RepID=A0ABY2JAF9_9MICO|nr:MULTISPECIES: hypothetical protein [Cryobacterium]TFC94460.1 hypothetical protein E3T20_08145 [Cryobacterium sp. TmT3-12]TFD01936.1 hypothetical protein E3O65_00065 [Cryobacterium breve]
MENNLTPSGPDDARVVSGLLEELQADRARLVEKVRAPKWLAPGFGLIAASYVMTPPFPGEGAGGFVLSTALAAGILLVALSYRVTGIKFTRFGVQAWAAFAAAVVGTLALFSVSLGLAASGLVWWIAIPAVVAFVLVCWLASLIFSSLRERLHYVR